MAYEHDIVRRASERLLRRRNKRQRQRDALERQLRQREPRLAELDKALRGTMVELSDLITLEHPVEADGPEISDIRTRNLALQREREGLLRRMGYSVEDLEDTPDCPHCRDSGWVDGGMCQCLKALCIREQMAALTSLMSLTEEQSFDRARLEVYSNQVWPELGKSPRAHMSGVLDLCQGYARQFGRYPLKNLLFSGATGLGKTFLSGCIAREVSEGGFSVVYDTAIRLFAAFETKKFTRDLGEERQARDDTRRYLKCDLLILDDLGSELTTPFVQSALYELVNSRLVEGRATIISTNLTTEDIRVRYSPQVYSRLAGEYRTLPFFGEDIRLSR